MGNWPAAATATAELACLCDSVPYRRCTGPGWHGRARAYNLSPLRLPHAPWPPCQRAAPGPLSPTASYTAQRQLQSPAFSLSDLLGAFQYFWETLQVLRLFRRTSRIYLHRVCAAFLVYVAWIHPRLLLDVSILKRMPCRHGSQGPRRKFENGICGLKNA